MRSCLQLFRRNDAVATVLLLLAHGPDKKNLEPAQDIKIRSDLMERIRSNATINRMI